MYVVAYADAHNGYVREIYLLRGSLFIYLIYLDCFFLVEQRLLNFNFLPLLRISVPFEAHPDKPEFIIS